MWLPPALGLCTSWMLSWHAMSARIQRSSASPGPMGDRCTAGGVAAPVALGASCCMPLCWRRCCWHWRWRDDSALQARWRLSGRSQTPQRRWRLRWRWQQRHEGPTDGRRLAAAPPAAPPVPLMAVVRLPVRAAEQHARASVAQGGAHAVMAPAGAARAPRVLAHTRDMRAGGAVPTAAGKGSACKRAPARQLPGIQSD